VAEKKRSFYDFIDTFIGSFGLRIIKDAIRKALTKMEENDKTFYLQLCYLFQKGDPKDREIVQVGALVVVEILDTIIEHIPLVPEKAKELFNDFGGDAVTEVRDYFAHAKVEFPADLKPLEGEDLKAAATKVGDYIVGDVKPLLAKVVERMNRFKPGTLAREVVNFLDALAGWTVPRIERDIDKILADMEAHQEWKLKTYSPENLKRHPVLYKLLAAQNPQRLAYERIQSGRRFGRGVLLALLALTFWLWVDHHPQWVQMAQLSAIVLVVLIALAPAIEHFVTRGLGQSQTKGESND
jgi:diacylglycerol kinase